MVRGAVTSSMLLVSFLFGSALAQQSIRVSRESLAVWPMAECYAARTGLAMVQIVPEGNDEVCRRSGDNGRTWRATDRRVSVEQLGPNKVRDHRTSMMYLEPNNGLLVQFILDIVVANGDYFGARMNRRIFTRISRDGGWTWGPEVQLVEKGGEYDSTHYARDVYCGRTSPTPSGTGSVTLRDGTIVFPYYFWPDAVYRETLPLNVGRECGEWYVQAACFLGRWRKNRSGIDWDAGDYMIVPSEGSPCGSDEPTVAVLDHGRLFMIVRTGAGDTEGRRKKNLPVLPHCAVSEDGGRTWGDVRPLTYSDGSPLYAPCAISRLIRSSKNRRWYWIANILDQPSYGDCDPRHPLRIAELDSRTMGIKKETVTTIEDKTPDDPEQVRFSNFQVYEDRVTHDFVLSMQKDYSEFVGGNPPRPWYRYRIRLP